MSRSAGTGASIVLQKPPKLDGPMPRLTPRNHFPARDIQRGEQRGGAVAHVVVRAPLRLAGRSGNRARCDRALGPASSRPREHQRALGRLQIEADDVAHFVDEERIGRELERLFAMRLQAVRVPIRTTAVCVTPAACAIVACAPLRRLVRGRSLLERLTNDALDVAVRDRARRPGRGASSSPSSRWARNRARHLPTVLRFTPASLGHLGARRPVALARIISARSASARRFRSTTPRRQLRDLHHPSAPKAATSGRAPWGNLVLELPHD